MKYNELKAEIEKLDLSKCINSFKGFEESLEFEHFQTFFAMVDDPKYTLMQCRDREEFNTSSDMWILCLPKDGKMYAIDMGSEDDMCDQFFNLLELLAHGFGTAQIKPKTTDYSN